MLQSNVYYIIIAACFAVVGAVEIFTRRCFFIRAKKYTEESIKAFSRHDGYVEIALGAAVLALNYGDLGRKACLVILIGALTYYSIQMNKILVKK